MKKNIFILLFILLSSLLHSSETIHVLKIDGSINPATSEYLREEITRAEKENAHAIIIELNTPGGLLESTREIVSNFLTSKIPIIVYVTPSGSQAASAGVFITLASHIAVMSPGTNIGAAHPVSTQGEMDSVMSEKVTNDASAFIRTISEKRNRNVEWAEKAVRQSISITETEALQQHVIDFVAPTIQAVLDSLDGKKIVFDTHIVTLSTKNAVLKNYEMDWRMKLLDLLSNPNVSYILFLIGIYGLFFELYNPGAVFPGVVGAIALVLALYSLNTLPVNYAGVALILISIILFILEIKITSYGMLTIGGLVAFFFGSVMLFHSDSSFDFALGVSLGVILPALLCTAGFFLFAIGAGIKAQKKKVSTGIQGLINETGITLTELNPKGEVRIQGEIWKAESNEGKISKETSIIVTNIEGLLLKVRKK